MLSREIVSPNNSQPRHGLDKYPAVAEKFRAAGWGIAGAGAVALLLVWIPYSPVVVASVATLAGLFLLVFPSFSTTEPHPTSIFYSSAAHLATIDETGKIVAVNEAWHQFAVSNGYIGEHHGLGLNYLAICDSTNEECSEAQSVALGIRKVLDGKQETYSLEYPCHSPTEERWYRCQISRFQEGRKGALVAHSDVTQEAKIRAQLADLQTGTKKEKEVADRRASRSLQEIADLKEAIEEHAIVAVCDAGGVILSVNSQYCEVSRFSEQELVGSTAGLEDIPERWAAIKNGQNWKGDVRRPRRQGGWYWVAETVVPFLDEDGSISQFIIIGTDITGRKETEVGLVEELVRSNALLAEFAYLASHDLQEPLRGVNGCVQLLAKRYGDHLDAEAREWIRHAVLNTERMQSLISGLLELSRIEHQPLVHPMIVDCQAVLAATLDSLSLMIRESDAVVEVDGALPFVKGDARQIGQVFQNLVANSIKFRGQDAPHITVSANTEGALAEFVFRDNGIGIDPRHAERIFGIFQRLHTPGKIPGAGMGLSIAKRIVERHGGRILVAELPPGSVGAEFRFTLPDGSAAAVPSNVRTKGASV